MFGKKGLIVCSKEEVNEDNLMEVALEAGAEDIKEIEEDGTFEVYTDSSTFEDVKKAFDENNIRYKLAEITMIPQTYIKLEGKDAENMLKLMEALEDCDDVQNVYANFDIPNKMMEALDNR
jgi:transcriptional/translational regulatory protein YebC/TACO1